MRSLMIRHGRKALELHKWCSLISSLEQNASTFSNSASATSHVSSNETFIISNLIDLYRWTRKITQLILEEDEEEEEDSDSVSNLTRSHCRISRNITCYPRHLVADGVEKAIPPKLDQFLQFRGASSSISFYNDSVRDILRADSTISPPCKQENIIRDVFILKQLGVPQELLIPLLNFNTSFNGKEKYKKSIKEVIEESFHPTTLKVFQALRVFYLLRD
ncbi:Rho GTPase activation protein [Arabidopsis thaliana x Arabidopsis arenosa]|uniref:Rho GTPase activation protein n=1 Tax=Arabidopsis thaliana x Arabidopsis arenosa TaxID=1240361 RepID=A0A8T1ZM52_9BRAS|nr:Rho GTPase activation protein [Arabidopsis thaliana x Arabidopsis arenosa]